MANKTLLSLTSTPTVGLSQTFPSSDNTRIIQLNPQVNQGFAGSVVIEGSFASVPGNSDYTQIMSVTFTGHTDTLTLEVESNAPTIRARVVTSTQGAIAVYADSADRAISGGQGATPATARVDSANRVAGNGNNFKINSVVIPSITSDDVVYANDFGLTLTQLIDGTGGANGFQTKIGSGVITADEGDVNLLTGTDDYGLTTVDLEKLADINVTATEVNRLAGITTNVQSQINTITATLGMALTGVSTSATTIDAFFDTASAGVTLTELDNLDGLTADAGDLNALTGSAGTFSAVDLSKLGSVTASAAELSALSGWTGSSTDLNALSGLTASNSDINAITGLNAAGVTTTQLAYLSGLTENVQNALNTIPNLSGLTASVSDLNTIAGVFSGTGAYSSQITGTEINYLNGLTGNIQTQLNNKRDIGVSIGISEISGASISTTELNYLQGSTSNIQAQIDALGASTITTTSSPSFTNPIFIANGSAAAPGLGFIAPNNTTGFYLFGANGIGMTVGGNRFMTMDGTDVVVGNGATNGSPTLKGVGFGVTDPAYTFNNDSDTGVYWAGVDNLGLSAGAESMMTLDAANDVITMGGTVANNNEVVMDGVFAGEKMLGRATLQSGSVSGSTGQTTLYTVPTGRSVIVTKIYVRLTNVTNFVDGSLLRMNIGFGGAFDELVDNTNNTTIFNPGSYAFNTVGQVMPLGVGDNTFPAISGSSGADFQVLASGAALQADVAALAGADDFDMEVIVFGHEFL